MRLHLSKDYRIEFDVSEQKLILWGISYQPTNAIHVDVYVLVLVGVVRWLSTDYFLVRDYK
jgi:hypothetical protein